MITLIAGIVAGAPMFTLLNLVRSRVGRGWLVALGNVALLAGVIAFVLAVTATIEVNSRKAELFGATIGAQIEPCGCGTPTPANPSARALSS